jgi:hypothetical protein
MCNLFFNIYYNNKCNKKKKFLAKNIKVGKIGNNLFKKSKTPIISNFPVHSAECSRIKLA